MTLRSLIWPRNWWRRSIVILGFLVGLYALVGFVVLPLVAPEQITGAIKTAVDREATIGGMRLNPFLMSVGVDTFALNDVDGTAMVEAEGLFLDVNVIASVARRSLVLEEARLVGLQVHAVTDASGKNNLAALAAGTESEAAPTPEPAGEGDAIPSVTIERFDLVDARLTFRDASVGETFEFEIGPLALSLLDVSTQRDNRSPYEISATAPTGEVLEWSGTVTIDPLHSVGTLDLENLSLAQLWRYVRGDMPIDLAIGRAGIAASYELRRIDDQLLLTINDGSIHVSDLGIHERDSESPVLALTSLDINGVVVDLQKETVRVGRIGMKGGELDVLVDSEGQLNLLRLAPSAEDGESAPAAEAEAKPGWTVHLDTIELNDFAIQATDQSVQPAMDLRVDPIDVKLTDFSTAPDQDFSIAAHLGIGETGKLGLDLVSRLSPLTLSGTVTAADLSLPAFASYVQKFAHLNIPSGTAGTSGSVAVTTGEDGTQAFRYDGAAEILDLALRLPDAREDLLRWQRLGLKDLQLDTGENALVIGTLEIADPFAQIEIDESGNLTIDKVMIAADGEATAPVTATAAAEPDAAQAMSVKVNQIRLTGGTVQFVDRSTDPDFRTSLDEVQLSLDGFVLDDLGGIKVDLQAKVDEDAPLVIKGTLSPPGYGKPADVKISLTGYDLTTVTPYVGRYAGYEIGKGRLSLDLEYKLDKSILLGSNDIVAKRFAFGERIESPDATTLPINLALAMLRDSSGGISLDVPVKGNVNDPQFSLRKTIIGTFSNVLQKAVTSPFSLLGSMVGGDGEELSHIEFPAGSADLEADQMKKLDVLAQALGKRPGLQLEIRGAADTLADKPMLARDEIATRLRQQWFEKMGVDAGALGDRNLEMDEETRQRMLFDLYEETFGREIARPADESVAERAERAEAALRNHIEVGPDALANLGKHRSLAIRDALEEKGVPRAQLFRVKSKVISKGRAPVPVQLTLSTAD